VVEYPKVFSHVGFFGGLMACRGKGPRPFREVPTGAFERLSLSPYDQCPNTHDRKRRWMMGCKYLVLSTVLVFTSLQAQASASILGSADTFAVLGGSTVTNTGDTNITGSLGVSPGLAITGFHRASWPEAPYTPVMGSPPRLRAISPPHTTAWQAWRSMPTCRVRIWAESHSHPAFIALIRRLS